MNIEEQLQELAKQSCPRQVDVVGSVMSEVRKHPYLQPRHTATAWVKKPATWALTAAAAVAALVVINIGGPTYDDQQISSMIASVSDYSYYCPVESAAENPIEFIYDSEDYYTE